MTELVQTRRQVRVYLLLLFKALVRMLFGFSLYNIYLYYRSRS